MTTQHYSRSSRTAHQPRQVTHLRRATALISALMMSITLLVIGQGNPASAIDPTPTVVVARAAGQTSIADTLPLRFTATFSVPVTGFMNDDVILSSTFSQVPVGAVVVVTESAPNDGTTYLIAVSAFTQSVFLEVSVRSDAAFSGTAGNAASNRALVTFNAYPRATLAVSHVDPFTQGLVGRYLIAVSNTGLVATNGTVSVTDELPVGLTATSIAGTDWTCVLASVSCTHPGPIAVGATLPTITVTVSVSLTAPALVINHVRVDGSFPNPQADDPTTISPADTVAPTIVSVTRNEPSPTAAATVSYTVTFSEPVEGAMSISVTTTGTLTGVTNLPQAPHGTTSRVVTLTTGTGSGTLQLNVVDQDTIHDASWNPLGGLGTGNGNFSGEVYTIDRTPNLTISASHVGTFTQGQTGALYSLNVANTGAGAATGELTVMDTLPAGMTATTIGGSGWNCTLATLTCTHPGPVDPGTALAVIDVAVNVAANAPALLTNTATLSGGPLTSPVLASDPTTVTPIPPLGAPVITGVTVTAVGRVAVAFTPPTNDGGNPVTGYRATCTRIDTSTTSRSAIVATSPANVGGLALGQTYRCTAVAINSLGTGPTSSPVDITIPNPPSAPEGASAALTGIAKQLNVTVLAPAANGGAVVSSFTATCTDGVLPRSKTVSFPEGSTASTVDVWIGSLTPGASYTCTAIARNISGASAASAPSASVSIPMLPTAPSITSITPSTTSRGQASVEVAAPASDGGSAVTLYRVTCVGDMTTRSAQYTVPSGTAPTTVTVSVASLTTGGTYSCTATARNLYGTGPASGAIPVIVPTKPGTAVITAVSALGSGIASLAVATPDGTSPITGYRVTCTSSNGGVRVTIALALAPVSVAGLTPAKTYSCTAAATNLYGTGTVSAPSGSFVAG